MYCFKIPDILLKNSLPIVVVGAGKSSAVFEKYIRKNNIDLFDRILCYMDDEYNAIKRSKDVVPLQSFLQQVIYLIIVQKLDTADIIKSRLISVGVKDDNFIVTLLPECPLSRAIWDLIAPKTKLKIIECGARGGNLNMRRLRFFTSENNFLTIGFDPDEKECINLNQEVNYRAYPYIIDDKSKHSRIMYQILQNGAA